MKILAAEGKKREILAPPPVGAPPFGAFSGRYAPTLGHPLFWMKVSLDESVIG